MKKNSSSLAKVKRSADPTKRYWSAIQKKVTGNVVAELSNPDSAATLLRLVSTNAATAMAMMERTRPIPMRWR